MILFGGMSPAAAAPCLIDCNFSISGKKGRWVVQQFKPEQLATADAAMAQDAKTMGLSTSSLSQGAFRGLGLDMPATEASLNRMLGEIARAWKAGAGRDAPLRDPGPVRARIIASAEFTASARPDGVIAVPVGLLTDVESDDELMWVLAHEYAHVALTHFTVDKMTADRTRLLDTVLALADQGTALAQTRISSDLQLSSASDPKVVSAGAAIWAYGREVRESVALFSQGLSRGKEDEADALAADLLAVMGYSVDGAGKALLRMERREAARSDAADLADQLLKNAWKPSAETASKLVAGQGGGGLFKGWLNDIGRNALQITVGSLKDSLGRTHRPAKVRRQGLSRYLGEAYRGAERPDERGQALAEIRARQEFRDAATAVSSMASALAILKDGKAADTPEQTAAAAAERMRPALAGPFGSTPAVATTAAYVSWKAGDHATAERLFDVAGQFAASPAGGKSRKRPARGREAPAAPRAAADDLFLSQGVDGFAQHIDFLIARRRHARALEIIAIARGRFGDDHPFLPSLISIHFASGNGEGVRSAIQQCVELGDTRLRERCRLAVLPSDQQEALARISPVDRAKILQQLEKLNDAAAGGASKGTVFGGGSD